MIYKLEIELRPQHLEDIAMWCYLKTRGTADLMLHNLPERFLEAVLESKAIKPDKWASLKVLVDQIINEKFGDNEEVQS